MEGWKQGLFSPFRVGPQLFKKTFKFLAHQNKCMAIMVTAEFKPTTPMSGQLSS